MDWKFIFSVIIVTFTYGVTSHAQTNLRGWFDAGQTWLVWEDTAAFPQTYLIYKSSGEISSISGAELTGRIFQVEGAGIRLKKISDTCRWSIPDGNGGIYALKENEDLFVYTPHEEIPLYFAVLRDDNDEISPENRVGPIDQAIDTIQCHLQVSGIEEDFPLDDDVKNLPVLYCSLIMDIIVC